MLFFLFKVIAGGLIIAFSSWLAGQNPKLAGFIKSIFIAVPASYLFFVPFFFAKSFNMNFFIIYIAGLVFLIGGYFIHRYIVNFL